MKYKVDTEIHVVVRRQFVIETNGATTIVPE